jgi:LmbE family N-acetylglucosaminyl deacetylase
MNRRLALRTRPLDARALAQPAVVVAPHPDDETLGCGGLIATKRAMGAEVDVVFMTDGSASHAQLVDPRELGAERSQEAIDACALLGVPAARVHFLPYRDGRLAEAFEDAVDRLAAIVQDTGATQVIVPHPDEPPSDHHAAYRIADAALGRGSGKVTVLLYPVWLWDQWPWTNPLSPPRARHGPKQVLRVAARGGLGVRVLRQWTHHLDLGPMRERKRIALEAHRTQMSSQDRPAGWLTLPDVANGQWLAQLLDEREYFARRQLGGHLTAPPVATARAGHDETRRAR